MGKQLFATSSFQSHSLPMLHIISRVDKNIPIYFINTGFHFPESLTFRDEVAELLGLVVKNTLPLMPKINQKDASGNLLFTSDPDYCCQINKVRPMDSVIQGHDIWINGIRADQNMNRQQMREEEEAPFDCLRYHPMLNWTGQQIFDYIVEYDLPRHPLERKGYMSIGCEPCTHKFNFENGRDGRWFGMHKTECGLHTELVNK